MAAGSDFLLLAGIILVTHSALDVQADCISDLALVSADTVLPIQENSPAGTIILEITSDAGNLGFTSSSMGSFLTVANGSVVTAVDVSLDGPQNTVNCENSKKPPPRITFYCTSQPGTSHEFYFQLNYTDDYRPYFTAVEASANESAPVGATVIDLSTIVRDNDCTNTFNYLIDDNSKQYFKLSGSNLELAQSLDYERAQEHLLNLTVLSSIQNQETLQNTTTLTIRVLDVDDMSPVFDISQFQLRLPEGQNISSTWYTTSPPIEARDGDVGINTTLVYSIHSVSPSLRMQINNQTGQVNVLEELDREHIPAYTVVVKASQADVAYRSATATLVLLVEDANDIRPVFTSQPRVTIMEDAPDQSYVMELTGEDKDEGDNSLFDFVITSDSLGAFTVGFDPTTNRSHLIVANSMALRGHSQAIVQFYLRERRPAVGPPCSNTTTCVGNVTVTITDVNDHTPQFNSSSYNFALPSNTSGLYVIGQVFAEDGDMGSNAVVQYSSTPATDHPPECSTIILDPSSGVLTTDQHLPPGAICSWLVTACDSPADANTRRCSVVPLTVSVIPAGNIFENSVTIPENVPVGTMVKSLPIKGLQTTSTEFEIRNDVLYTKVPLDREQRDSYEVTIVSAQNVGVMIVYVNVSDVNDNAPVFGQSVYVINVDRSWKLNQTVLQVNATDADIGPNARLEFSMATGREYFAIDPTSGQIQLTNFPTTRDSEYQLLVKDFGSPSFSSLSTLKVYSPMFNETAAVVLPVNREELMADRDGVARQLGSILGMSVRIYDIESLGPTGSKVYISAMSTGGQPVSPTELKKLLDTHEMEIYNTFAKSHQPNGGNDGGRALSVLEIVLICLASVLLVLLLVAAFLWRRSHKKLRQSRRLFDSLNKDTAIYDNPRKPSSSAAVIANNNSTNAQKMMARLSNGSLGNSSVTNLLTAQGDGNNSQGVTPPGSSGSQRRQQDNEYANVVILPLSSPLVNHEDTEGTSPVQADQEQITTFSSQISAEGGAVTSSPQTDDSNQHDFMNSQAWPGDNTAFSGRHNSSTISDTEAHLQDADEDDQEVANILSDPNPDVQSLEDTVDSSAYRSNLDLMTTSGELESAHPGGVDNPVYLDTDNLDSGLPPEPEPDYAKRVRFTDATAIVDSGETTNSTDNDDKESSLAKFLNQYGGAENLATNADTTQDSLEEMTAL